MKEKEARKSDLVDELLELPKKNLEARIRQLEQDIKTRLVLNEEVLSRIGTSQLGLQGQLWQLRYVSPFLHAFRANRDFQAQLQRLDSLKINEELSCFKDMHDLKVQLQSASEELETAKRKLRLVKGTKNGGKSRK